MNLTKIDKAISTLDEVSSNFSNLDELHGIAMDAREELSMVIDVLVSSRKSIIELAESLIMAISISKGGDEELKSKTVEKCGKVIRDCKISIILFELVKSSLGEN